MESVTPHKELNPARVVAELAGMDSLRLIREIRYLMSKKDGHWDSERYTMTVNALNRIAQAKEMEDLRSPVINVPQDLKSLTLWLTGAPFIRTQYLDKAYRLFHNQTRRVDLDEEPKPFSSVVVLREGYFLEAGDVFDAALKAIEDYFCYPIHEILEEDGTD